MHASDFGWTNAPDVTGCCLAGPRVPVTSTRTEILFLFTKVTQEECKNTASDVRLHESVIGSPLQQLVIRQRWRHVDVIKLSNHLLLHQRRQHALYDAFTELVGYRLQTCHRMEYVTDCLPHTLHSIVNSGIQRSLSWIWSPIYKESQVKVRKNLRKTYAKLGIAY